MSEVTNVLLAFSILEDVDARLEEVNGWLDEAEQLPLRSVWETEAAVGGGKRMETPLYAGAFNGFDLSGFLALLRTLVWSKPDEMRSRSWSTDSTKRSGGSSTPDYSFRLGAAAGTAGPRVGTASRAAGSP